MRFEEEKTDDKSEKKGDEPEVPEDFICIDPQQKPLVFEFLTNFNQEIRKTVLVHLKLCLHCQELAANSFKKRRTAESWGGPYLIPEIMVITDHFS